MKYELTNDPQQEEQQRKTKDFQLVFNSTPFGLAMQTITQETGIGIVWAKECDETIITGVYINSDVYDVLTAIARRGGFKLSRIGELYYIGSIDKGDNITAVMRAPSADVEKLNSNLAKIVSENGSISVLGGVVLVTDTVDNIQKVCTVINQYRDMLSRGYVAEVFFLRMSNSDLIDLQAKLEGSGIDILSSSITLGKIFEMYINVDGSSNRIHIENRPVLYLSEGRKSTFEVGSDITLEKKSVSQEGYSTTSGYQKFSDGLKIEMLCNRVSKGLYSCDFDLSVSKFEDSGDFKSGVVPKIDKSSLVCPGLMIPDGGVLLVGSLTQRGISRGFGTFTISGGKTDEIITIWVRLREISVKS